MQRYHTVNDVDIVKIHEMSLKILEEIGIVMTYDPARELLKKYGAKVEGRTVFFPPALVEEKLRLAPGEFTLYARNPEKNVYFNTEDIHYCAPGGSIYVQDIVRGRRKSTQQDFDELIKLYHMMNGMEIHHVPCEMNEIPTSFRNKFLVYETYKYSDKPLMGYMYGYKEAKQCLELAAMPFGGLEAVRNKAVFAADPCSITPLCYEEKALGTMMLMAEYGQIQLVNSLGMSGTTSPITLAGNAAVQNAEILAGITLIQCTNPGAPVIYSTASTIADMRTGSPAIGAAEAALMSLLNGQIAKFYHLPCRISGTVSDSKCPDAQAGYESMMNLMTAVMAGGNFILHCGGILDTYNTVDYEKLMIDYEIMGMVNRISEGIPVNEEELAYGTVKEVGPQGTFLAEEHTIEHLRTAHYEPVISDRRNFVQWEQDGKSTAVQRASTMWKNMLEKYKQPDLPKELDKDMKMILERYM